MKLSTIIILVLLFGCSSSKVKPFQDSQFKPYIRRFELFFDRTDTEVRFGSLSGQKVGKCVKKRKEITIDLDKWLELVSIERELVVFHELGHCELKLEHDNLIKVGCPKIMNRKRFDSFDLICYHMGRNRMIEELRE